MEQKKRLAHAVARKYQGQRAADAAAEEFARVFGQGERPEDVPTVALSADDVDDDGRIWIIGLLDRAGLVESRSDARRLVEQGAVAYDGARIDDVNAQVEIKPQALLKVGKRRFAEIQLKES